MARKKNAPTQEQINFFFERIKHYQNILGLRSWRIENSGNPAGKGCMADVDISPEDKLASVSIGMDWGGAAINEHTLDSTAAHECGHVWLRALVDAASSRDPAATATEEHSCVVILEKILVGDV